MNSLVDDREGFAEAVNIAKDADAVILCLGLSPELEGEEGDAFNADAAGDRLSLKLPGVQEELMERLAETGTPLTVVLLSGSVLDLRQVDKQANAVIQAWYPGQDGGQALAEILLGDFNPMGRLPITFVHSDADLPPFQEYAMKGRTYRYLEKAPLYPFGYGLSYTTFEYTAFTVEITEKELLASVTVKNTGAMAGNEIIQFYHRQMHASVPVPNYQLSGFKRIYLEPGNSQRVTVQIPRSLLDLIDENGNAVHASGAFRLFAGGQQPDERSEELTGNKVLVKDLSLP